VTDGVAKISLGRRVKGFMALVRLPATATTTVLMGLLVIGNTAGAISASTVLLAAMSYFCVSSSGFAINDYFDVDIDTINKPYRPIPAGIVSKPVALAVFGISLGGSMVLALLVNQAFAIVTIANAWLVAGYSAFLKRRGGLLANVVMGVYVALLVMSGVLAAGSLSRQLGLACVALALYMVGNQIVMCIEDLKGDTEQGARTLPITIGIGRSLVVALGLMSVGLVVLVATVRTPFEWMPLAVIFAFNLLIYTRIIRSPTPKVAGRLRVFMALSMIMMMVVVILRGPRVVEDGEHQSADVGAMLDAG